MMPEPAHVYEESEPTRGDDDVDRGSGELGMPSLMGLATGGMVGGGIYVALGVVVEAAGRWAWLSFLIAGVVAVATAYTYASLSNHFRVGGGAFEFLEAVNRRGMAGSLSWVLLTAYTLTIALYAVAFGEYASHAFGLTPPWPQGLALGALIALTALNLAGLGAMKSVEIVIVSANLLILLALAIFGLVAFWAPQALSPSAGPESPWAAWTGAATIFVAYEGFQLLTYEYEEVDDPERILMPGLVGSAAAVVVVYVAVTLGATMIAGASSVIEHKGVALSVAAARGLGAPGMVALTAAATLATSAAINSTLFSSAKLARRVADDGELPAWLSRRNSRGVPSFAMIVLSAAAGALAWVGSLGGLVEAASLAFLAAFGSVHLIAIRHHVGWRWISVLALGIGSVILTILLHRLATSRPIPLALVLLVFGVSVCLRPWLLRQVSTEEADDQ